MVYGTMIDDKTVLISESTKEIIPNILFGNNGHENNHMSN
ncbi:BnaC05g19940D [Brassica napus]|uniref:BnaC05g19940D protein n=1 Tax=Brassica napus TaxID=3708 RepID=A0A078FPE4_BRANA|nr:BnaC05g19940D [Brassica napus]